MSAPSRPTAPTTPDLSTLCPSWPDRWDLFKGTPDREACLHSLIADATAQRNNDWLDAAQECLDDGTDDALNALIREQDEQEAFEHWRSAGRFHGMHEATHREFTVISEWRAMGRPGARAA